MYSIKIKEAQNLVNYIQNKSIFSVGVFFNEPVNQILQIIKKLKIDYVQLHGEENSDYINEIKKEISIKVIKNIPIKYSGDFLNTKKYSNVDMFLFDYKPSKDELPGGNAKTFSWDLISDIKIDKPWFLSGGINIHNINEIKNYTIPYGTCELNGEGHLKRINEKPEYDFLVNTGLYVVNPYILHLIPKDKLYHITHLIEDIKNKGKKIGVYPIDDDAWIDVGQWAEYQKAVERL